MVSEKEGIRRTFKELLGGNWTILRGFNLGSGWFMGL